MRPDAIGACESDMGHLSVFGYSDAYCGRGPLEALGLGFVLKEEDVAFRANFATLDSNAKITDRRAGRIEDVSGLVKSIDGKVIEDCRVYAVPGIRHRAAVVIRGKNLGSNVSDTDNAEGKNPKECYPKDYFIESYRTAHIVNRFSELARTALKNHPVNKERLEKNLLPANCLLLRGAGKYRKPQPFGERYGMKACAITEGGLYGGIGKFLGMDTINVDGVTDKFDTDLEAQFSAVLKALGKYGFVFMHVKPTDVFGHDGKFAEKMKFIEKFDAHAGKLHSADALIVITADHSTPCKLKAHSSDPVPILIHGKNVQSNGINAFSEKACARGMRMQGKDVMPRVVEILKGQRR